ncbi:MAG: M23 family metallopeptidase [Baekduia sp.]
MRTLVAAAVAAGLLIVPPAEAGWHPPLDEVEVAEPFAYDRSAPFAAGQRRGADLAAAPGAPVRAVCSGRVRHAGRLPGGGRGVSIDCGALIATELGLALVELRRDDAVRAGQRIGAAGKTGRIRLGARRDGDPFAYRDPLALLDDPAEPTDPLLAPRARGRPRAGVPPAPAPVPAASPAPSPSPVPLPVVVSLGLGLALLLAGSLRVAHGLLRHHADLLRQRRAAPRPRLHHDRRRRARPASPPAR